MIGQRQQALAVRLCQQRKQLGRQISERFRVDVLPKRGRETAHLDCLAASTQGGASAARKG
jgi:hypothetical protein